MFTVAMVTEKLVLATRHWQWLLWCYPNFIVWI